MAFHGQIIHCNLFSEDKVEELHEFLHACIDHICINREPKFRQFQNVDWTKEEFIKIHKHILTLLHNPSCLYINKEKMPPEYHKLPQNVQQAIFTCLSIRKNQLTDTLLLNFSSKYLPTLYDFDWRLKYVMGSSKMASIREPLLQLDFILKEKQFHQILELELNKDELDSFINAIQTKIT